MYAVTLPRGAGAEDFKPLARRCLAADLSPRDVAFVTEDQAALLPPAPLPEGEGEKLSVPRSYAELLHDAACHREGDRFDLLYDVLWRIRAGERSLPERAADPVVARLLGYARNVRRDIHKMHAFLRFRAQTIDGREVFTAWFEPQHHILRRAIPFFVDRFAQMDWVIATPEGTAAWQDRQLRFGPPGPKPDAGADGVLDDLWLTYYRTTFNPARLRLKAMTAEMPKHYWNTMPETALIPGMVAEAGKRVETMRAREADAAPRFARKAAPAPRTGTVPAEPIAQLRAEAAGCTRCPLHANATQTVFGEGPEDARIVLVGEQPGDQEDLAGRPFVGPAGKLLDRALAEAGIDRGGLYLTNAVKHFKYEPRGKKRIHMKPNAGEVRACRWWLERELTTLQPQLVVALGATAAQSLAGRAVSVLRERGPASFASGRGFITVHPSFLLRLPDAAAKEAEFGKFVADLRAIRDLAAEPGKAA